MTGICSVNFIQKAKIFLIDLNVQGIQLERRGLELKEILNKAKDSARKKLQT